MIHDIDVGGNKVKNKVNRKEHTFKHRCHRNTNRMINTITTNDDDDDYISKIITTVLIF